MPPELRPLDAALRQSSHPLRVWWRDDDAGRDDPRLDPLLDMSAATGVPVAVAVVPAWLERTVALRLSGQPSVTVLQHGWAHEDHAWPGERRIELGGKADRAALAARLRAGRQLLEGQLGGRFEPVLVPPWNRIAPDILALLGGLGFAAVSTIAQRPEPVGAPASLPRLDVHLDLVDWHARRPLDLATAALRLAGLAEEARGRPVGLLTHHQVLDDDGLAALRALLSFLARHRAVEITAIDRLLLREIAA